jgi:hypothetical protein
VTPEKSTHVDTAFTGTTSSFSRTASGRLAAFATLTVHDRVIRIGADRRATRPDASAVVESAAFESAWWRAEDNRT